MIEDKNQLINKLFKSSAVNSIILERKVFESLSERKWQVSHSPYYIDFDSKKHREIDVVASKYWNVKDDFSCRVNLLIECKSLKDYHIIVDNKRNSKRYELKDFWIGNDNIFHYQKIRKLLKKAKISENDINTIIKKLDLYCSPDGIVYRNANYIFNAFKIDAYNVFRETNIANTKDIDNSVIWKCQQSLSSCISSIEEMFWADIDYSIKRIKNDSLFNSSNLVEEIVCDLIDDAKHKEIVHPVIVVESNLWELNSDGLGKLNYFRLCFQQLRDTELWVDIVHVDHLDEYFENLKIYDDFIKNIK
ncbi:hypothetical protein [Flavobacterium ginsenosidimutans]|uniref:hypothetical protein n=1 Tax=Flavobacterium ginsenosidimutans TaxID=687844 RepID=UPI000DAEA13D|nr:hypothetical protein [Flavobacterium ginsenosidimutans]KAF2336805.1 hypothetical protein DM444_03495 [Flavobacterium ginsenosidimutans]